MATLFMLYILSLVGMLMMTSDPEMTQNHINGAQVPPTKDTGAADITMECIPNNHGSGQVLQRRQRRG